MKYIIGNWKSQKTTAEGEQWLDTFAAGYHPSENVMVGLAPTIVSLENLAGYARKLRLKNFDLAVQDISPFPRGSYTGAVAADLVKSFARYAIVGHSERKRYFHETVQDTLNKATEAVDAGLVPLVCVDEMKILSQLTSLAELEKTILVAYTPYDPLVSGKPEPVEKVVEILVKLKKSLPFARLLYGGAISQENCSVYLAIEGLDGLFVGSASLDASSFAGICSQAG